MASLSAYKSTFILQHDQSDCGIACLLSLVRYYGGLSSLEKLRKLSGTSTTGTTLLGLYQCASKIGFEAEAFEAEIEHLKAIDQPCILHVLMPGNLPHYVICYGQNKAKVPLFIIGDPGRGIIEISEEELTNIWQSKTLLTLTPNNKFITAKQEDKAKWQWFCQLLKNDINILIVTMVLGLVFTLLGLATAIFSQRLIDDILPSGNERKLIISLVLMLLILLIRSGIGYIRQHFLLVQGRDLNNRMVGSFFNALVYLPKSFFDTRKTGDMITRMEDTARIQRNVANLTGTFFIDVVVLLTTSIFLINYSLIIALITFGFIPLIVILVLRYIKPIKERQREVMMYSAINESNYIDTIQGIAVIKDQNKEEAFTTKVKDTYDILQTKMLQLGKQGNQFNISTDIVSVVLTIVLFSVASFMVLNKQLKLGEMIAIISLVSALIPAVARLSQVNLQLQEARVAFDRMYELASVAPEYQVKDGEMGEQHFKELKVEQISFRFPGRKAILQNVSFELHKGQIIALLGESGCGKSTTMQLLQKFYEPERGQITVNGKLLNDIYTPAWRNMVATVPQEVKLFNGTLLENISIGCTVNDTDEIINFCRKMGFDRFFEQWPQTYHTLIGEEGVNLSGGQKQLVALARALYRNPQVLLLDEATAAMDRNTERFILQMLSSLRQKMAILMITHKMSTASMANYVYIIDNGLIQDYGVPADLMRRDNFYSQALAYSV